MEFSLRGGRSASHSPSSSASSNTNARTTVEFHHEFPGVRTTSCTTTAADESARPLRLIVRYWKAGLWPSSIDVAACWDLHLRYV
jgi:hypothetical protein